jgi:glycosyltransferase involved in cell wall biosynthesis
LWQRNEQLTGRIIELLAETLERDAGDFYGKLDEEELADLFTCLQRNIPPKAAYGSSGFLDTLDHIQELRNTLIRVLVSRGTSAAVNALQTLADNFPELPLLKWQIVDARSELNSKAWTSLDPREIIGAIAALRPQPAIRSTKEAIKAGVTAQAQVELSSVETIDPQIGAVPETIQLTRPPPPPSYGSVVSRRILLVGTEWRSAHGGLSTLNRELCVGLAAIGHDVVCLVVDAPARECDEAKSKGVRLVGCPHDPLVDDTQRLFLFDATQVSGFVPDIIVGHDHVTGPAGYHIAYRVYSDRLPYVHFIHTLPEEIEPYKSRSGNSFMRGAQKADAQMRQCRNAQLVVGVGPRIFMELSTRFVPSSTVPVVEFRPGLDANLLSHRVNLDIPRTPYCLFLGRLEDGDVKGVELACKAILALCTDWEGFRKPRLIIRGFDSEDEVEALPNLNGIKPFLIARPYTSDAEEIARDIRSSSAIIMPSKREGFGLVALEGIAAGVPILVTSECGMADLLLDRDIACSIGQSAAELCVADVLGSNAVDAWASRLRAIFSDLPSAFSEADRIRAALRSILTWENAARGFSNSIEKFCLAPSQGSLGD